MTQLTSDWLSVNPNASSAPVFPPAKPVPPKFDGTFPGCTEGGGVFERQGKWYLMFGACCCFCHQGSNAYVFWADAPLGPYTFMGDVVPWNATLQQYALRGQQFGIMPVHSARGDVLLYTGQRWGSALDGKKCHDWQYWAPLEFDSQGRVQPMRWVDKFELDMPA